MAILDENTFKTVSQFRGFVDKPEITNLDPRFLVPGSQNVYIDYAARVLSRPGYILFGAANNGGGAIKSSYEWATSTGKEFPLRVHDGKLEFCWNNAWNLLKSGYATNDFSFAKIWDNTEKIDVLMYVMGDTNQYKWSGGVAKIASATRTSIHAIGNSASLTAYSAPTGTASIVATDNSAVGVSLIADITLSSQPANGQTLILNINGTAVSIQFVTTIGAVAGNVLIGATLTDTYNNLLGLLTAPSTTNTTQVALSAGNQTLVGYITWTFVNGTITKQGVLTAKTTIAFVAGTPGSVAATITDSANGFVTAGFAIGDTLYVQGSPANSRNFTIAGVTAGTITLIMSDVLTSESAGATITVHNGEPTWAASRFLMNGTRKLIYNGVEYTYTGGETTDTLTGLTFTPYASITIGDPVWQSVVVIPNSNGIGSTSKGAVTLTIASPAVFTTSVAHGLSVNDIVFITEDVTGSGSNLTDSILPTGISPSTGYYVISAGLTTTSFELSATSGGVAINTSGSQSGTFTLFKTVPTSFKSDFVAVQLNQLILASSKSREVYISSTIDYTAFVLTSPRVPGDPAMVTMDDYCTTIQPMDNIAQTTSSLIFGAGKNNFFQLSYQLDSTNTNETVRMIKFKTANGSGLISKGAIVPVKNSTAYINREPALDTLANVQNTDDKDVPLSDLIKNTFDRLDFTGSHLIYWKRAIYISVPTAGLVLIYDLMRKLWQPPWTMPIGRFAVIGDWLYGHSSVTNETYKLYTGTNDNGNFIPQVARFAYNNGGLRSRLKHQNQYWSDGYLSPGAPLIMNTYFGFQGDGAITTTSNSMTISTTQSPTTASPLGSESIGSLDGVPTPSDVPLSGLLRFYKIETMPEIDFLESFVEYKMNALDGRFAIVAHGSNMEDAQTSPVQYKD